MACVQSLAVVTIGRQVTPRFQPDSAKITVNNGHIFLVEIKKFTNKMRLSLVKPLLDTDELEALAALYVAITGMEAMPDEMEQARKLLETT